jgi:hypothetical protein
VSDLDLLPTGLAALSRLEREIALPYPEVLEAVDTLEADSVLLLGWEALATYPDGGFGAYPSSMIGGVAGVSIPPADQWGEAVSRSAARHRATIEHEWQTRETTPPAEGVELIFCLTVATRDEAP